MARRLTMSKPGILDLPSLQDSTGTSLSHWIVTVFNNATNTFDEVIDILMRATACTEEEAEIETWEIDALGKSVVHHGGQEECERAAGIIRLIGISVEVSEEA